jgi:methylated-DNA-[protein]-cysteine S-methyltransferase
VRTVHAVVDSPIGPLTLVGTDRTLTAVYYPQHAHGPDQATFGERDDYAFSPAARQLADYFAGTRTSFGLALAATGNAFQQQVWALLGTIPYGETRTYGQLAAELGDPRLARAVGAANSRNPLSIVVPCHRVVGAGGKLTGYAGGLNRKAFLLALESRTRQSLTTLPGALF